MSSSASENLRRQFRLPAEDEAFLNTLGLAWETLATAGQRWIIIKGVAVPPGYNHGVADVGILVQPGYPPGPLDMAYFHPWLIPSTGRIPCNTEGRVDIDGRSWQAWSRHRIAENAWIPGEDNLESHYFYMHAWLSDELKR